MITVKNLVQRLFSSLTDEKHFNAPQNRTSLTFQFALKTLFRMQNDQPASSSPADHFPKQNIQSDQVENQFTIN
jgi:hypothetical protein